MRIKRVLIADDIEVIAKTNQLIVEKNDSVSVIGLAYNGQDEYDMIIELKPDIVITDNQMPKMNGVEVAEKIINSNLESIPKFILVTGDYGIEFNKKCKEIGISSVVNKNNREIELPNTLEELIAEMELEEKIESNEPSPEYKKWYEEYSTIEKVNLKKYFTSQDLEILKKLGIEVKDKIYTEREFEELDSEYILFYYEDNMTEQEKSETKSLENTGVTRKEYNNLLDKFHKINLEFNF